MMHIAGIIAALIIVVAGVLINQSKSDLNPLSEMDGVVLSEENEFSEGELENSKKSEAFILKETEEKNSASKETFDNDTSNISINISQFQYPNSEVIESTKNYLLLESTDTVDDITDWYEGKIRSMAYNVRSFVKTSANGNVLNKLVAGDGLSEASAVIEKENQSSVVSIEVVIE